jgi:hypothetical protein
MARQPLTQGQKRLQRRGLIVSLASAALLLAIFIAMDPILHRPKRIDDLLAIMAGAVVLQMGLLVVLMNMFMPKDTGAQRHRFAQPLNCLIASATILLPIVGAGLIDPRLNFAIVMVLTAISTWLLWLTWRGADELMRDLMKDGWLAQYFIIIYALIVYAVGERLGLFGGVTAWGVLALATLLSIPCSVWVAWRRGLDRPPADD